MRPQLPTIHPSHPSAPGRLILDLPPLYSTRPVGNGRHVGTVPSRKTWWRRQSGQDVSGERVELPYHALTRYCTTASQSASQSVQ